MRLFANHKRQSFTKFEYYLNGVNLKKVITEKDPVVWIDNKLDFEQHAITKVKTTNWILALA